MNIALINPKLKTWSPNVYLPLGLAYIASALDGDKHSVKILDLNSQRMSDNKLVKELSQTDIIGITGMITEYNEVVRLSEIVKISNAKAKIVLGGALATTHTDKLLSTSMADVAVIGEGERTIVEIVKATNSSGDFSNIKGIAYKSNGEVKVNTLREPIKNIDSISYPARHFFDMSHYTTHHFKSFGMKIPKIKSTTLISSRGCPYFCSFCFHDVWGHKWRGRSPDNIIGEIKILKSQGFNGFVFNDDTFVVDRNRVLEFCGKLKESELNINWYCNGRVNLMSDEMLEAMSESGCKGIAYGIESGNQGILDSVKKRITLEQVERVTELTKKYGIHVTGYFMVGILGDSVKTIQQTIDFARKLNLDFYGFAMTSPIHGTSMYNEAKVKGLIADKELEDWSFNASVNMTTDCDNDRLEKFNKDAFTEFTIEKRYGKHYLLNPLLWLNGFRSLLFLIGKRSYVLLLKKAWGVIVSK